jgi:signal transduction histidine kinase
VRSIARWSSAVAIALFAVVLIRTIGQHHPVPYPGAIYICFIVIVAFWGGLRAGIVSMAVIFVYVAYSNSISGSPFRYTREGGLRVFVLALTSSIATMLMGLLVRRIERAAAEKERMEAARLDAQAESLRKERFLATVSHELRAPIATMLIWEGILSRATDDETRTRATQVLRDAMVHQSHLIDDLIDLSRANAGKLHLHRGSVDLDTLVRSIVDELEPSARKKELVVKLALRATDAVLWADARRLRQVLTNLLANAIKFTPNGGHIAIDTEAADKRVTLRITDTGKGIDPKFRPRLFLPFAQADESITRSQEGLGLGLAISKHLVELHGGMLLAESAGNGTGTCFTVDLPLAEAQHASTESTGALESLDALIVTLHASPSITIEAVLGYAGAQAERIDLETDLSAYEWRPVDVIIFDGPFVPALRDFLRSLRSLGISAPAIAVGGGDYASADVIAIEGAFDLRALSDALTRALAKPQSGHASPRSA